MKSNLLDRATETRIRAMCAEHDNRDRKQVVSQSQCYLMVFEHHLPENDNASWWDKTGFCMTVLELPTGSQGHNADYAATWMYRNTFEPGCLSMVLAIEEVFPDTHELEAFRKSGVNFRTAPREMATVEK